VGRRSFGPLRASRYSFDNEDYLRRANDHILVALILETKEAVDNMDAIASVPGIDVLYLGPFDLCLSLGLDPMAQPHPEIDTVLTQMIAVTQKTGVAAGLGVSTPEQLLLYRDKGFRFLGFGSDYSLLAASARTGLAVFGRKPAI
jgi:4-hydroxy-2-oxoheptanedioate aldolase